MNSNAVIPKPLNRSSNQINAGDQTKNQLPTDIKPCSRPAPCSSSCFPRPLRSVLLLLPVVLVLVALKRPTTSAVPRSSAPTPLPGASFRRTRERSIPVSWPLVLALGWLDCIQYTT